ncbi:MAG: hypothetical protein O4861_14115 [Trichodesmium sp. St16_bin4-tuft]|nr:hypothetical protein [Trichodesmium sp. St16_bin4-tuft]
MSPISVDSSIAPCMLHLWDGVCNVQSLVDRLFKGRPLDPTTLEPIDEESAWQDVTELLDTLSPFLYVLLEL